MPCILLMVLKEIIPLTQGNNLKIHLIIHKKIKGVKHLDSGIYYKILEEGIGSSPDSSHTIKVHYREWSLRHYALNRGEYSSSYDKNEPFTFKLEDVILGWQSCIPMLKRGSKALLIIPERYAYGKKNIEKHSWSSMVYEIELIDFE